VTLPLLKKCNHYHYQLHCYHFKGITITIINWKSL